MHDVLEPQRRSRAKLRQAYSRGMSLGARRADDAGPVHGCDNGASKVVGIKTKIEADKLYLMNVLLTAFGGRPAVADDR